ncbi:hypothetical protein [Streptomyces sp. P9-A2]|uniref:hypothetical protein n=1 Tax=Streptomyces sp. P9-A2 TaxID=3072284 RepID=UPI002FC8F2CD
MSEVGDGHADPRLAGVVPLRDGVGQVGEAPRIGVVERMPALVPAAYVQNEEAAEGRHVVQGRGDGLCRRPSMFGHVGALPFWRVSRCEISE